MLLGNGDGTFRVPILHSPEGGEDGDVVLGDFNKRRSVARNLPGARLLGPQTLSHRGLTSQGVRGPLGNVVPANLDAIATRLATSAVQPQDRVTPDPP